MRKSKKVIIFVAVLVVTLAVACTVGISISAHADDAVRIGNVTVKGAELDAVWRTHAIAEGKTLSVQEAARKAAKTSLAEQDLKGNSDIPSLEEFYKEATAHYADDKAENDAFCERYGITPEQLNDAVARSKRSIQLYGAHYDFVINAYRQAHTDPAEKLDAIYDTYITEKLGGESVTILDEKRVSALEENIKSIAAAKDRTGDVTIKE